MSMTPAEKSLDGRARRAVKKLGQRTGISFRLKYMYIKDRYAYFLYENGELISDPYRSYPSFVSAEKIIQHCDELLWAIDEFEEAQRNFKKAQRNFRLDVSV